MGRRAGGMKTLTGAEVDETTTVVTGADPQGTFAADAIHCS
jgi:hypothetical protein